MFSASMESLKPTSVYGLEPGVIYIVSKPFVDHYGGKFEAGELLTFETRHFLPYHGGHTIVFRERGLYLQEDDQAEVLTNLANYLAVHDASSRRPPAPPPPAQKRENPLSDLITSLCFVVGFIVIWIWEGRAHLFIWAGLLLFGTFAVVSGIDWWKSRRGE